ncbi:MAG: guanylate kinase [Chloroflexi bacterium]|nr:MAG: guanylate kinase [Chloroflexota bacterium]
MRAHRRVGIEDGRREAGASARPAGDRAHPSDPRAPRLRPTPYRWRPGVWKAWRPQRSGTPVSARVASGGPFAARRRAHLHRAARARARCLPARIRHAGLGDEAARGGPLSIDGRGLLVIISAPSGAGKDVVIDQLVQKLDDAVVYVTATSRKPRPGEVDGVRYYFYSPEKFRQEIEAGNFYEWSIVHGEFKGVRRDILGDTLGSHKIVIVKPDPQGMRKIKSQLPEALTIFIMPPSIEALQRRLEHRGTETPEQRAVRLRNAEIEMAAAPEYDYVVVNEDGKLDQTVKEIAEIIRKEMTKPRHYEL